MVSTTRDAIPGVCASATRRASSARLLNALGQGLWRIIPSQQHEQWGREGAGDDKDGCAERLNLNSEAEHSPDEYPAGSKNELEM